MRISVDDGCASDLRLAELCKKYGVELIFYWPANWILYGLTKGWDPLTYSDAYQLAKEFEIGSHTVTHRLLTQILFTEVESEIIESKLMLEALFNKPIEKFCPPRGYTNPSITELTLKYYKTQRLTKADNLVHIHPNSGANDSKPWQEAITVKTEELWAHSWELDRYPQEWQNLEDFLKENS